MYENKELWQQNWHFWLKIDRNSLDIGITFQPNRNREQNFEIQPSIKTSFTDFHVKWKNFEVCSFGS